jgi:hypothetical protein
LTNPKFVFRNVADKTRIVPARVIGTGGGGIPILEPDIPGPADPAEWQAGLLDHDGKFIPKGRDD